MIDEGLVRLIQGNAAVKAMTPDGGGFLVQLPKDQTLPSWTLEHISNRSITGLQFANGLRELTIQINAFGNTAAEAVTLAAAIDDVLNGFSGKLTDSNQTFVSSAFSTDEMDDFDEVRRTYRRWTEYQILFAQD